MFYWTFGNFLKPLATINLPKSPTFLGNFCKGVKTFIFLVKSFLVNFYRHLTIFSGHTGHKLSLLPLSNKQENRYKLKLPQKYPRLKTEFLRGVAIAQWICLCLPSCRPRFESQIHHLHFHQFIELCNVEKTKINRKVAGIGPFLKNNMS